MDTIYFINYWEKIRKEECWSGTPYSLLNALKAYSSSLLPLDLEYNIPQIYLKKIVHAIENILSVDGSDLIERMIETNIQNHFFKFHSNPGPAIAFSECNSSKLQDTYFFIDCSVDFAYRCFNSPKLFSQYVPLNGRRNFSLISQREKYARNCYQKCKGIFTMGQWIADDLVNVTGIPYQKVHCVGGGVNVDTGRISSSHKNGTRFLFVGKDFERKGGPLVVDAFSLLNIKYHNKFELYIAGPRELFLNRPIPQNVHFLGYKTSQELIDYYNLCDVFVMPSIFEAYGLVFAEALVYGLPIIARNAFAMKDFVQPGENGYLLDSDSKEELAMLMYSAISDVGMRQRVMSRQQQYLEQYSWNTVVGKMLNVMRNDGYEV